MLLRFRPPPAGRLAGHVEIVAAAAGLVLHFLPAGRQRKLLLLGDDGDGGGGGSRGAGRARRRFDFAYTAAVNLLTLPLASLEAVTFGVLGQEQHRSLAGGTGKFPISAALDAWPERASDEPEAHDAKSQQQPA